MKKYITNIVLFILGGLFISACQSDNIKVSDYHTTKGYQETKSALANAPVSADFYMDFFKDNSPYQFVLWGNGSNDSLCCDMNLNEFLEKGTPTTFHTEYEVVVNVKDDKTIDLNVQGTQSQLKIQEQAGGYVALKVYREGTYCGDVVLHDDFTKSSFVDLVGNLRNDNFKTSVSPLVLKKIFRAIGLIVAFHELFNDSKKCCCGGTAYQEESMLCLHQGREPIVKHSSQECIFTCKEKAQ